MFVDNKIIRRQVRESYRFLFDYQSRLLDLMSYIEKRFGLSYHGGHSKFSNPSPKNGKGRLDLWAWDWLNLYYYEFHFAFYNQELKAVTFDPSFKESDYYGFSIFLVSDDGYFQNHLQEKTNGNRIKLERFKSVDESKTRLIFVASKNIWDTYWWHCPKNNNSPHEDFMTKDSGIKVWDVNTSMVFKSFDLDLFFEERHALDSLKEFENLCSERGIIFKVLENKFLNKK